MDRVKAVADDYRYSDEFLGGMVRELFSDREDEPNLPQTAEGPDAAKCQRCGVAPAGVTHICPPPEFTHSIPLGPACPLCYRNNGSHSLGCAVETYVEGWKEIERRADAL